MQVNVTVHEKGNSKVAVVESEGVIISDVQDALDLLASISYSYDCHKIVLGKENLAEAFFELRTKLAGDILQKFTNYQVKLAVVGDFSGYDSKSLRDFIYECNQGEMAFFLADQEAALEALHRSA